MKIKVEVMRKKTNVHTHPASTTKLEQTHCSRYKCSEPFKHNDKISRKHRNSSKQSNLTHVIIHKTSRIQNNNTQSMKEKSENINVNLLPTPDVPIVIVKKNKRTDKKAYPNVYSLGQCKSFQSVLTEKSTEPINNLTYNTNDIRKGHRPSSRGTTMPKKRKFRYRRCRCSYLCLFCSLIASILLGACISAVTIALINTSKTKTTTTTMTTVTTTTTTTTTTAFCNPNCLNGGTCLPNNTCQCITDVWFGPICQTPVQILWQFDNNLNDFYNKYPGVGINAPTYNSPGINGFGSCLYLNASRNQSVTIYPPPFLNMAYTSFSLVAWVKPNTLRNNGNGLSDNAIFGQFQNNANDQSLHIIVRAQTIYFGFYGDDTQGNRILYPGNWYHMAYIYDYSTLTQYVYVNGFLDVSGSPKGPYQGTSGSLTIGTNGVFFPNNYWDGCLDQIAYFGRMKTATEILRDATLTVDYTFDNNSLLDSGPLLINGTGSSYSFSPSGRINSSLSLLVNQSYIQATGLVLLGTNGQSYSFSIWIKPTVITGGTIIHVSQYTAGNGWCFPVLGLTSTGSISVQSWNSSLVSLSGPSVTANLWTHVAITYSTTNGLRLWVNGTQYGSSTGAFNYITLGVPLTVTIGSSLNGQNSCQSSGIQMGQYYGYIDEFQLYSRELNSTDIYNLANP